MSRSRCEFANFCCMVILSIIIALFIGIRSRAAVSEVTVNNGEPAAAAVYVGDTGVIKPNIVKELPKNDAQQGDEENNEKERVDDKADIQQNYIYYFESDDTGVLTVDNSGNFVAVSTGIVTVSVSVYVPVDYYNELVFNSTIQFTVSIDMTNVTLSTYNVYAYMYPTYYYMDKTYYSYPETQIVINSPIVFDELDETTFSYVSSNPVMDIEASITDNVIYIYQSTDVVGASTVVFYIYGKEFVVNYQSLKVDISDQYVLLVKKKQKRLNVTGYEGDIIWSSSNPSIATVDANGNVKGKRIGNVIIRAKIGDRFLGCAVSVTTAKLKKVAERANYIGTHWKYSQAKRTRKGYYDCSALVWKAYKEKAGVNFGSPGYPGVAISEAKWCKSKGRMIKGGMTSKKLRKMTVNPGDLLFKSSDMKRKYSDIYHVEMFTGYFCHFIDSDGTAYYSPIWAARGTFYIWEEGSLLGRPMK